MELGLFSFGDYSPELFGDHPVSPAQRLTNLIE